MTFLLSSDIGALNDLKKRKKEASVIRKELRK